MTVHYRKKVCNIGGKEFVPNKGKALNITKALYGIKISGAAFRVHLSEKLDDKGFKYIIDNTGVCMIPSDNPYGKKYYDYILVYVDGILCISHDPMISMKDTGTSFIFKKDNIGPPDF